MLVPVNDPRIQWGTRLMKDILVEFWWNVFIFTVNVVNKSFNLTFFLFSLSSLSPESFNCFDIFFLFFFFSYLFSRFLFCHRRFVVIFSDIFLDCHTWESVFLLKFLLIFLLCFCFYFINKSLSTFKANFKFLCVFNFFLSYFCVLVVVFSS